MRTTLRTLVAVDADLASSIAIRYGCMLAKLTGMRLQPIHVVEPDQQGHTPGTGWVRRTWEDALLQTGGKEVSRLIQAEMASCPGLGIPKTALGERENEILGELETGGYDLFIEGILHSFVSTNFYKKIHSRLYRYLPCPVLLVKNLVDLEKGILLMGEPTELPSCVSAFLNILGELQVEIELLGCRFNQTEPSGEPEAGRSDDEQLLLQAENALADVGRKPKQSRLVQGAAETFEPFLRDSSLVVAAIRREKNQKDALEDLLARTPLPVLLCWC